MLKRGDATHYAAGVFNTNKQYDVSEKISNVGLDGASVNLGRKNGLMRRIQDVTPGVNYWHCVAHQLALIIKHASKHVQYLWKEFFPLLKALGYHIKYSSKRSEILLEVRT
jgi:hypothetical protein